jgi:ABC-2 type transport system ATP-binding protein
MLGKLRHHNITIIVSTPYMDEAMKCDRVALIQKGRIMAVETPEKIIEGFSRKLFSARATEKYRLIVALRNFPGTITAYPFGDSVHVTFTGDFVDPALYDHLKNNGVSDASLSEAVAGIEDRFLELMNIPE